MKNLYLVLCFFVFVFIGCATSSDKLNLMAKNALETNAILRGQASSLNDKFLGADKNTVLAAFGKPRKIDYEPSPYTIDPSCRVKDCLVDYANEFWAYEFKGKFASGWEYYSVYVYFKDDKVVRIR